MSAQHVEWHMRQSLAPIPFGDCRRERAVCGSPVEKAQPSEAARRKAATGRTADDLPVHGFRALLDDLSRLALNRMRLLGRERQR